MPGKSNPKGGKGHRKNKKPVAQTNIKNMEYREEGEEYARVTALLGNGRVRVQLPNKTEKLAIIPGRMKKKRYGNFITVDDITLVGVRSYQQDKVDVLYRYNPEQVLILQAKKELPEHWTKDSLHQDGKEIDIVENDANDANDANDNSPDFVFNNNESTDDNASDNKVCDETGIDFDEI